MLFLRVCVFWLAVLPSLFQTARKVKGQPNRRKVLFPPVCFYECKNMRYLPLLILTMTSFFSLSSENLVLVTIDGLRWQEVFYGADETLISHKKYVKHSNELQAIYWDEDPEVRREKLMPFVWQTLATQGVLIGDRNKQSYMSVSNQWYFSYPGYNEILTGQADPKINSNASIYNNNVTFLEWLNNQKKYQKKLAAFGSWNVFPYIYNEQRSGLYINAAGDDYLVMPQSDEMKLLNEIQRLTPSPWREVRQDSFTYKFAEDYLRHIKPKVLVINLGETDDFAHDGDYDRYLKAATRTDNYLRELWQTIQSTDGYKNNTVMLIVTDHGRGYNPQDWQHHASVRAVQGYMKKLNKFKQGIIGAEQIWMAAIGPGIRASGLIKTPNELKQDQIAATALTILGEDYHEFNPNAGKPILEIFE